MHGYRYLIPDPSQTASMVLRNHSIPLHRAPGGVEHDLEAPVILNQIRSIAAESCQNTNSTKEPHGSSDTTAAEIAPQSQTSLGVSYPECEQCSHGVVQCLSVAAIQFGDTEKDEGKRDVLNAERAWPELALIIMCIYL